MTDTIFSPDCFAADPGLTQFEGLPVTITVRGEKRTIGHVEAARITSDRTGLLFSAKLTDEEAAGILGAAQDRNLSFARPLLPLSDQEITDIIASGVESGQLGPLPNDFEEGVR